MVPPIDGSKKRAVKSAYLNGRFGKGIMSITNKIITFLFMGNLACATTVTIETLRIKYSSRHFDEIQLPSGKTHYQSVGSGPAVILVHGVSGPLSVWDKNV